MISIRSPVLNDKSPSACASKSYNATTYTAGGTGGFGLGLRGGGGGALLAAAAEAAEVAPPLLALYGGGGGFLAKAEAFELARNGGGVREVEEDDVVVETERPKPDPPAARLVCTILAENKM